MIKVYGFTTVYPKAGRLAGGSVFFQELMKRFSQARCDVKVKVPPRKGYGPIIIDGVMHSPLVNLHEADIIVMHSPSLFENPDILSFKKPVIYVLHSWVDFLLPELQKLEKKDYLISNSRNVYECVKDLKTNHRIIYPICNEKYMSSPPIKRGRYLTLIGSSKYKNIFLFYELAKKHPELKFLHIIGGYGPERLPSLENIRVVPNTKNLLSYYRRTKLLIAPSVSETYSLVSREAGLLGIPVISSDLPGFRENLGEAGIYADPTKVETFEKKMKFLLENPEEYRKVSENIQKHCQVEEIRNEERLSAFIRELKLL